MSHFYTTTAIKYSQNNQKYLSLVLPFEVIQKISKVLIYGDDKYGYQRKLNERHYKTIKKDIVKEKVILPTSIILSVDNEYINKLLRRIGDDESLVEITLNTEEQEFRIVDGQHRIRGLEEAVKEDPIYNTFQLNVIMLITETSNRLVEVKVFRDINSLGKKIKTDLTLLAIHNYELLEQKDIEDLGEHIAVKTAYYLNEKIKDSVWHQAIQFDVNADNIMGIIGVSAFKNSISSLTKMYLKHNPNYDEKNRDALIVYTDNAANDISKFLNDAWGKVLKKWSYCFKEKNIKESNEYINTYYNEKYYLQKTTGTHAVNSILADCVSQEDGFSEQALQCFINKIWVSQIKSDDWLVGGIFSGLTSGSGFKKAKDLILKQPEIEKNKGH